MPILDLFSHIKSQPVTVRKVECWVFRDPLKTPMALSFGVLRNRPAVFLRIEDSDGAFGFGEVFSNWPASGAEHRCRLLAEDMSDLIIGRTILHPFDLFERLSEETKIRALQCVEFGPFQQVIAGLDIALWDLFARKNGMALAQYLNPDAPNSVTAYASGIHVKQADEIIAAKRVEGFSSFKIKVGFDLKADGAKTRSAAQNLKAGEKLMTDANQAWDLEQATQFFETIDDSGLDWVEEPMIATAPIAQWQALAKRFKTPIAGGENLYGFDAFSQSMITDTIKVYQPDIAKWGGITGCYVVGMEAQKAGYIYCPHFLGSGIGLAASAHLLAGTGAKGQLELDVNPNPMRESFGLPATGEWALLIGDGIGIDTLPKNLSQYQTLYVECNASGYQYL